MYRALHIFIVLASFVSNVVAEEGLVLEPGEGFIQEWMSEKSFNEGVFRYSVKLIEMPNEGPDGPRSKAWFGLSNDNDNKRFLVVFVNTPHGEGIKYGYEYKEGGEVKYFKSVFNKVPLSRDLSGEIELKKGGVVIFRAAGVEKTLETGLSESFVVIGATSSKVEFFPDDVYAPNKSPQPSAEGGG